MEHSHISSISVIGGFQGFAFTSENHRGNNFYQVTVFELARRSFLKGDVIMGESASGAYDAFAVGLSNAIILHSSEHSKTGAKL